MKKIIYILMTICLMAVMCSCTLKKTVNEPVQETESIQMVNQTIYNADCSTVEEKTGVSLFAVKDMIDTAQLNIISPDMNPIAEALFRYEETSAFVRAQTVPKDGIHNADISGLYYNWYLEDTIINTYEAVLKCAREATILIWTDSFSNITYNVCVMKEMTATEMVRIGENLVYGIVTEEKQTEPFTVYKQAETEDMMAIIFNSYSSETEQKNSNAALVLLDFSQSNADKLDQEEFKSCCALWLMENGENAEDFLQMFAYAYYTIKEEAFGIIEKMENGDNTVASALSYESYSREYLSDICQSIESAIAIQS